MSLIYFIMYDLRKPKSMYLSRFSIYGKIQI